MKHKPLIYLIGYALLVVLTATKNSAEKSNPGNREFYLIDSLDLSRLDAQTKNMLDSALAEYRDADDDTTRLHWLKHIVSACDDDALWPSYNRILLNETNRLLASTDSGDGRDKLWLRLLYYKAEATSDMGLDFQNKGKIEEALEIYEESLRIRKRINDLTGVSTCLNNLAYIYWNQGDAKEALRLLDDARSIQESIGDQIGLVTTLTNTGAMLEEKGKDNLAMKTYRTCLNIVQSMDSQSKSGLEHGNEAYLLHNLAFLYLKKNELDSALEYNYYSLAAGEVSGTGHVKAGTYRNMGEIFLRKHMPDSAYKYATESLSLSQALGYPDNIKFSADLMSDVFRMLGNHQQALEMRELSVRMSDSINNESTNRQAIHSQLNYEFERARLIKQKEAEEQAEAEAAALGRRNSMQYSAITLGFVILCVALLLLAKVKIPVRLIEGGLFFTFLILFEFLLVIAEPSIETFTNGAPAFKLLVNAGIAAGIFPIHAWCEKQAKKLMTPIYA